MVRGKQTRRFPLAATLLILSVAFSAVAGAVSYFRYAVAPPNDVIAIEQARFNPAGTLQPPPGDDPGWITVHLPHDWRDAGVSGLEGWYVFDLPLNVPPNRLWGMYLPRVTSNVLAYLNDEAIGGGGRFSDPVARNWNRPLYFSIPNGVLQNGINHFTLHVKTAVGSPGYLGAIYLGPDELLRPVFDRSYWFRVGIVEILTAGTLMAAVLILGLWATRRKDTMHLWFSAMSIASVVHNLNLLVVEIPVSLRAWECMRYLSVGWFVVFLVTAMHRFIGVRNVVIEYSIYALAITGSAILCLLPDDEDFFLFASRVWSTGVLLLGIYPAIRLTVAWWQSWNPEYLIGMCTGLPILAGGAHDWLRLMGYIAREHGYLMQYSVLGHILGFIVVLLMRYVRALNESESLVRTMEAQIEKKRLQIESNYRQMRKMEHERVLAAERERIMRDMHDGVGGHLVSVLAMVESNSLDSGKFKEMLGNALLDLRLMIDSLDQTEGDLLAVLGMLRMRLQPVLEQSGIEMRWQVKDIPAVPDLGPGRLLQIMRILQEAITNVLKHSGAKSLTVTTGKTKNGIFIEILDDGTGIQVSESIGHGLHNMRSRAGKAGVYLLIQNAEPGTRVRVSVPLAGVDPQ